MLLGLGFGTLRLARSIQEMYGLRNFTTLMGNGTFTMRRTMEIMTHTDFSFSKPILRIHLAHIQWQTPALPTVSSPSRRATGQLILMCLLPRMEICMSRGPARTVPHPLEIKIFV